MKNNFHKVKKKKTDLRKKYEKNSKNFKAFSISFYEACEYSSRVL